jgi:predicted aspartyl protease
MMMGNVNSRREAIIQFVVIGENNQQQGVKAVIDTGYTGFLTLPSTIITTLGLAWFMQEEGILGDGSMCMFNVFEASVISILRTELSGYDAIGMEVFKVGMGFNQGWV